MGIKKTLIHFNDITLTLSADDLKAALIAKYGDAHKYPASMSHIMVAVNTFLW